MIPKIVNDYVINPLIANREYISFAAPFLFSRSFIPFRTNEPISYRLIEGAAFTAIASYVQYCVNNGDLEDYSYSILPIIFSGTYHQNMFEGGAAMQLAGAAGVTAITKMAIDSGNIYDLIPAATTYTIANINNIDRHVSYKLAALSGVIDYLFCKDMPHYTSWATAGAAVSYGLFGSNNNFIIPAGVAAGAILAASENLLIDQFASPTNFYQSYNALTNFVSPEILNPILQNHYITLAHLQIGIGFYGNYLLTKNQEKTIIFSQLNKGKGEEFKEFINLSLKYIVIASIYTATRTIVDTLNNYHSNKLTAEIQNKTLNEHMLREGNFIQLSTTNSSVLSYLRDIGTITQDTGAIIQWSLFGIAKLSNIGNLNYVAYAGLGGVIASDALLNIFFQYLTEEGEKFAKQQELCNSQFAKVNEHDKEYAVTILQKNALNYTRSEWNELQDCYNENNLWHSTTQNILYSCQGFYNQDILYTGLHMVIAYMANEGVITPAELFLYTRTLQTITESILFKSKNQAAFSKIDTSITRLNELYQDLYFQNNSIAKINYQIDENKSSLLIEDLDFTRGNKEQASHLSIDSLELFMGKIYALTGANGSGKSSITTLLQYVLSEIADPSFTVTNGNITYPASSINMIPQKDYIPIKVSLFDLIMYPNKENESNYEASMIKYINELQVFKNNITSQNLYEIQDSWKDLSGGQKKKLYLVKELITCPKILFMDEFFSPLDPAARPFAMETIQNSCLKDSLILVVWHQDKNTDGTSCVIEPFFDYEAHIQNETVILGKVGVDCI